MSIYIIAEVGPNHNGSLETALEMVGHLAETGCDAIKFQLAVPENVYSKDAFKAGYQVDHDGPSSALEMSRRVQLPADDHRQLYAACQAAGVDYICTAFDMDSLRFLDENFDLPYFKVPSGEILTTDMLDYMAQRTRPILLSTGMATFDEIEFALGALEKDGSAEITILHCVSLYPAPPETINLNLLPRITQKFGKKVGYSDHSEGIECCLGAAALGATVLEKHVTSDRSQAGPDHRASATIEEFTLLVDLVRRLESALGDGEKIISAEEDSNRQSVRKSVVASRDIAAGEIISIEDICFKRPGRGVPPNQAAQIVGRSARTEIKSDRLIHLEDLV